MVTIINDPLADTNGVSLVAHTGPDGTTYTQHPVHSGVWQFQGNRIYPSTIGAVYATTIPGTAEYDIACDYQVLSDVGSVGLAGRISTSADTFYYCYYLASEIVLAKRVAGTITSLDVLTSFSLSAGAHTMKLEIRDAAKRVYIDGVLRASSTDNTITAAGRAGVRSGSTVTTTTGKHISNLVVTDIKTLGRFASFAM